MSIILEWPQIQKLQGHQEDLFWCKFKAPKVIMDAMGESFSHYDDKWKTKYCDTNAMEENCKMNLPSDCLVNHLVLIEYSRTCRIRLSVINAEYRVDSYTFKPIPINDDFIMETIWNRRLNCEDESYDKYVACHLNHVVQRLQNVINHHWYKHVNRSDRLKSIQTHLRKKSMEEVLAMLQENMTQSVNEEMDDIVSAQYNTCPLMEPIPSQMENIYLDIIKDKKKKRELGPCPPLEPANDS